jgi:hypothetical protein
MYQVQSFRLHHTHCPELGVLLELNLFQGSPYRRAFSRYEAQQMSGSIQSQNFVPGVSGWKLDHKTGEFEINSVRLTVGSLSSDPQMITVTAGEWSNHDLLSDALAHIKFTLDEMRKIPVEHQGSAEFSTGDHSYDRDGSDIRTTLTYERLETPEEVATRTEKAKVAATGIMFKAGVLAFSHDGAPIVSLGDLSKAEPAQPFVVVDDQVFMSKAFIEAGTITALKLAPCWGVKMELKNGKYVAAGLGLGSQFLMGADRFAIKEPTEFEKAIAKRADAVLEMLTSQISETTRRDAIKDWSSAAPADQVRDVIRAEMKPGGLLYRSK